MNLFLLCAGFAGCQLVDDKAVEYNTYRVGTITPAVPTQSSEGRKVHVGHDFPVNVALTADYDDVNVPLQYYLLNVDDVKEVEAGTAEAADIRTYYCEQSSLTTISKVVKGTGTYGNIINIPADSAIDPMTGHYKTGTYYVVADVNKYDSAEPDAYEIYQRSKDKLDAGNTILITTEYLSKPDLSLDSMNFTGGADAPKDVVVFYDLVLNTLPGGKNLPTIYVRPTQENRYFTGTVNVRSSSCDSLNVPINFTLESKDGSFSIPLKVYDEELKGYQDTYYIPLLKANTSVMLSLGLMIPDDTGAINYFDSSKVDAFNALTADEKKKYYLSQIRHQIGFSGTYGYTEFEIVATINKSGQISESRFVAPKSEDGTYDAATDYDSSGTAKALSATNNKVSQPLQIKLEKMEVEANQGIQAYPYCKLPTGTSDEMKTIVIFWDGLSFAIGDTKFGGDAEIHEGMFFYNYSLYSLGCSVNGYLFNHELSLINTYLNAEAHPYNAQTSNFAFNVQAGKKTFMSDSGTGFAAKTWEHPIMLASDEKTMEKMIYFVKAKLVAGYDVCFTPGLSLDVNQDGSLKVSKYAGIKASVHADASASIGGLATIGLYTYLDVISLDLKQDCYTTTTYDQTNHPGMVMGTLNRNVGLYLTGPKGYINAYFAIKFLFISKRWEKELYSFTSFTIPILEQDFAGSGSSNYWQKVENADLLTYDPASSMAW